MDRVEYTLSVENGQTFASFVVTELSDFTLAQVENDMFDAKLDGSTASVTVYGSSGSRDVYKRQPVTISGVSVADKVYDGRAASYTGTPVATASGETVEVSAYTYTWQSADGTVLSSAPVNAGSYKLVIAVAENDPNYVGSTTVNFTISKATVTVTVEDVYKRQA